MGFCISSRKSLWNSAPWELRNYPSSRFKSFLQKAHFLVTSSFSCELYRTPFRFLEITFKVIIASFCVFLERYWYTPPSRTQSGARTQQKFILDTSSREFAFLPKTALLLLPPFSFLIRLYYWQVNINQHDWGAITCTVLGRFSKRSNHFRPLYSRMYPGRTVRVPVLVWISARLSVVLCGYPWGYPCLHG